MILGSLFVYFVIGIIFGILFAAIYNYRSAHSDVYLEPEAFEYVEKQDESWHKVKIDLECGGSIRIKARKRKPVNTWKATHEARRGLR